MHKSFMGDSIYLAEADGHFPELTLRQTLTFCAATRVQHPGRYSKAALKTQNVLAEFNLEAASDTKIGSAMIRGLSGGEKRRTSIAEVYISEAQIQCWDNSTRGLDSATALSFVQSIRTICNTKRLTIAMSIYQASDSIYEVCTSSSMKRSILRLHRSVSASIRSCYSTKAIRSTSGLSHRQSTTLLNSVLRRIRALLRRISSLPSPTLPNASYAKASNVPSHVLQPSLQMNGEKALLPICCEMISKTS